MTGPGEVRVEVDQVLGCCSGIAIDDLVVVTHTEAVIGRGAQQPDQEHVGGVEVLELVDQEMPAAALRRGPGIGVLQQDLYRPVDLLVEVDGARFRQRPPVAVESFRQTLGVRDLLLDLGRWGQAQPDGRQCIGVGDDGVGVRLTRDLEDVLHEVAHGRVLQDAQSSLPSVLVADPEAHAVERLHVGPACRRGATGSFLQLVHRLAVEGQRGHRGGLHPAVLHQVPEALGQDPRLARTRWSDDPGAPLRMADGRQLVRGEVSARRAVAHRRDRPRLGVPAMDDADAARQGRGGERATVDVERGPVRKLDVGGAGLLDTLTGESPSGLARMPPNRVSAPGVVGVRPDQEVEAVPGELEIGAQVMDRSHADLAGGQHLGVDRQLHHNRLAIEPGLLQAFDRGARVGDRLLVDGNPGAASPGRWRGHSRQHDNAAAKLERPWHGHPVKLPEGCFDVRTCRCPPPWPAPRLPGGGATVSPGQRIWRDRQPSA